MSYVRTNFFYGRTFISDMELNDQAEHRYRSVANVRIHGTLKERPIDRFDHEREFERYGNAAFVRFDDGLVSGVYVFVTPDGGIISSIDDNGIMFLPRDPALVWACSGGSFNPT